MNCCYTRAKAGDPRATEAVVSGLRVRVARMAAYYARRCQEDPDDLLQEAWVGLLEALHDVDIRIGSPEQYLIQRARWRLLDAVKRARVRRCAALEDLPSGVDTVAEYPEEDPSESLTAVAMASAFAGELKTTQRQVLDCLLLGLTWREAGTALGCSSANIAYHVRQIQRRYEEWNAEAV